MAGSDRARASRSARGQTGLSFALVVESPLANSVTSCAHHDLSTPTGRGLRLGRQLRGLRACRADDTCHGILLWASDEYSSGKGTWHSDRGSEMEAQERRTDPSLA